MMMLTRWTLTVALALTAVAACSADDGATAATDGASGKADTADGDVDASDCSLEAGEDRTLAQFVSADHVQFRCRGPGGQFVETGCCADEIDEFQFATGCPLQAKFNTASGADKRCVQDSPDAGEVVSGELFVPTVCCEMLCDPGAGWDDPSTQETCRNSQGQFHPHVCCMMNDNTRCGGAQFDEQPDSLGFRHCRAQEGEFAGQFAPAACCLDTCFGILESQEQDIPIECLLPLEDECTDTEVDAQGVCRAPDGRFAKGLCCFGQEGLDVQQSDECRLAELTGQDLVERGCE
jgi:hypothetical protein